MHVVIVYDADPERAEALRRLLVTRLHRVQNSVWAGELTRIEWQDLNRDITEHAGTARVQAWLFDRPPTIHHYGTQKDNESIFL